VAPIEFARIPPNWQHPLYWIETEMRIVFARALDGIRTAMVIELMGNYRVGVVCIERMEDGMHRRGLAGQDRIFGYSEQCETRLWLVWEWYQHVSSPEEFMDQRGWERPPTQQQITKPVPRIMKRSH
jgi:hypothetical protein